MQNKIIGLLIVLLAGSAFYLNTFGVEQLQAKTPIKSGDGLNIMIIGDVGTGNENQINVAKKMNVIAEQKQSEFVLSFGDNFYEYGLTGINDPKWNTAYADIYPKMSYLKDLPWLGVIGNHDYRGVGLFSEFEYKKNNWLIEDFFWVHTSQVGDKKIAFLHMDTSYLAYGSKGETSQMSQYFRELGWTSDEDVLALAEEQLKLYNDYDYVIAMGHHHIGHVCPTQHHTGKLYDLLQKYQVSAYLNGHSHTLAYKIQDDMGMIVSGAGGKSRHNECAEGADPSWAMGYIFGFVNIEILEDEIEVIAYYIDDQYKNGWKEKSLPSIPRRNRL